MNQLRLQKVVTHMQQCGLSQLIVTSTASVYYLTGIWVEPLERMLALYIGIDGTTALFGNEIFGIETKDKYFVHRDGDNPIADLADYIKGGVIGIDKMWPSRFLIELMEQRKDISAVLGSAPLELARMIKDDAEIAAMQRASAINDLVIQSAISAVGPDVPETALAQQINQQFMEHGANQQGHQIVCFGKNAADPHHEPDGTCVCAGDCVLFDIFTPIDRYYCDMTRTVFYGHAPDKAKWVYEVVQKANEAAIACIRPGVKMKEIDHAARKIIEDAGFGPFFTHRLGHHIGLECHEQPDVNSTSDMVAQPGMVFSIEPGIYLPGEFGIRIEDLVVVLEDGAKPLNSVPKSLRVI